MPKTKTKQVKVRHDKDHHQFQTSIGKDEAYLKYRDKGPNTLEYYYTYVPEQHRGQQIATQIANRALHYAKDHNLRVIPTCSFVESVISRNKKEFGDIVDGKQKSQSE